MGNTIQGNNPAPPPAQQTDGGGALPVSPHGAAEAVIDQVVQQLDDQRMQTREMHREVRREQRAAEKRQLRNERKAAACRLAGGLVNAAGQAAQGGMGVAAGAKGGGPGAAGQAEQNDKGLSARELEGWGQASQAVGGGLSSVAGFVASHEETDAKAAGQQASNLREVAQEYAEDAARMQRLQDKAMSHRERIADARLQAQLRSSG